MNPRNASYKRILQTCRNEISDILGVEFESPSAVQIDLIANSNIKRLVIKGRQLISIIQKLLELDGDMLNFELTNGVELATCEFRNLAQKTYVQSHIDRNYEILYEDFPTYGDCTNATQQLRRQYDLDF